MNESAVKLNKVENEHPKEKPAIEKESAQKELKKKPKHNSEKALVQKELKKEEKIAIEKESAQKKLKKKENTAIEKELVLKQLGRIALEVSKEMVNGTVRKSVTCAKTIAKFPPATDTIQKLSQPRNVTYIALYNKFSGVLKPQTVSNVKEKIAGYLETIEDRAIEHKLVKDEQMQGRKKQKLKAKEKQKKNEFTKFCYEQCDEIFELFLEKFTKSYNRASVPKPLVMGPNSRKLYDNIRTQFMELVGIPPTPSDGSVDTLDTDETVEIDERIETVETLSYFIMEFVKNSFVDALKIERK